MSEQLAKMLNGAISSAEYLGLSGVADHLEDLISEEDYWLQLDHLKRARTFAVHNGAELPIQKFTDFMYDLEQIKRQMQTERARSVRNA